MFTLHSTYSIKKCQDGNNSVLGSIWPSQLQLELKERSKKFKPLRGWMSPLQLILEKGMSHHSHWFKRTVGCEGWSPPGSTLFFLLRPSTMVLDQNAVVGSDYVVHRPMWRSDNMAEDPLHCYPAWGKWLPLTVTLRVHIENMVLKKSDA